MKWTDVTSYSRGDKERKPTCWQITDDDKTLTITVVWNHRNRPGEWCFHCHELNFDTEPVDADSEQKAKAEAIRYVVIRLQLLLKSAHLMMNVAKEMETGK